LVRNRHFATAPGNRPEPAFPRIVGWFNRITTGYTTG
jgi:hypothetical protein